MNSLYTRIDFRESHELLDLNAHSPELLVLDSTPSAFLSALQLTSLRSLGPAVLLLDSPQLNNYLRDQSECKLSKEGLECKLCVLKQVCLRAHQGESKGDSNPLGQISTLAQFKQLLQTLIKHQKYHKRLYHSKGIISLLFAVTQKLLLECSNCQISTSSLQHALAISTSETLVCSKCSSQGKSVRTLQSPPVYLIVETQRVKDLKLRMAEFEYQLKGCSTPKGFIFMTTSKSWFNLSSLAHVSPQALLNAKVSFLVYKRLTLLENTRPIPPTCEQPDSKILAYPNFNSQICAKSTKLSHRLRKYIGKYASCKLPVLFGTGGEEPQSYRGRREVHEWLSGKYRKVQRDSWDREYDRGKLKKVRKRIQKSRRKIDFGKVALMNSHI